MKTEETTATERIVRPKFTTEREEADWWANHPEYVLQELKRAKAEGRLGHGTAVRRMAAIQAAKSPAVEIDPADLPLADRLAQRKGMERHVFLKALIHDALEREDSATERAEGPIGSSAA